MQAFDDAFEDRFRLKNATLLPAKVQFYGQSIGDYGRLFQFYSWPLALASVLWQPNRGKRHRPYKKQDINAAQFTYQKIEYRNSAFAIY